MRKAGTKISKKLINFSKGQFNQINDQVVVDQSAHFNLITYERDRGSEKVKYDPQTKLRKLENRAQINRAQRQIDNRQKKKSKHLHLQKQKQREHQNNKPYRAIYQQYIKDSKAAPPQTQQLSDQQSAQNKTTPKKIHYFRELKRHPLLLEYTLKKIDEKEKEDEERVKKLDSTLMKMSRDNSQIVGEYKELLDDMNRKILEFGQENPQMNIQNRFTKFFSKKSSDRLPKDVMSIPRCSRMIERQNEIVSEMKQNSLSKENRLKLKSRLNEIINSISRTEKHTTTTLPKLQTINLKEKQKEKDS